MKFTVVLLMLAFIGLVASAQSDAGAMKVYYLVFLKKGADRNQDSVTAARIQEAHLAYLGRMAEEGKLNLAGPVMTDGDLRGICVYNVATENEARSLAEGDPAVKAGRLKVEVMPWYSQQGASLK